MNLLRNLQLSKKLGLMMIVALGGMLIIGILSYVDLNNASKRQEQLFSESMTPAGLVDECRVNARAVQADIYHLMLTDDPNTRQALFDDIKRRADNFNSDFSTYEKIVTDPSEKALIAETRTSLVQYRDAREEYLFPLIRSGKNKEAYQVMEQKVKPPMEAFLTNLRKIGGFKDEQAEKLNADTRAANSRAFFMNVTIVVVVFVIAIVIGVIIVKIILNALEKTKDSLAHMAKGDFACALDSNILASSDEFGDMARGMDSMKESLRSSFRQVINSAEQVAASSEELTATTDQTAQAVNQVAVAVTTIATGSDKQTHAVSEATGVIESMSASLEQVAATANNVSSDSAQMVKDADEGGRAADTAIKQMDSIQKAVSTLTMVINKLGDQSQAIGQIVNTIASIAAQTNLLALNAAIEAARAGEQGRGFAVVAEEVRKLAEQSQEAAKQISKLIIDIQTDTDHAVNAMSQSAVEVKNGAEVVNEASDKFKVIVSSVSNINAQMREISAAVEEMASGSQKVVESVRDIETVSKNAASQVQTVSAATEETSASTEEIASSSRALATIAMTMQEAVSKFKI